MSLVFAGIAPHSPVLIPSIGKEKTDELQKTIQALKKLTAQLYAKKPEVLIILSPHASLFEDVFTLHTDEKHIASFEEFGDVITKKEYKGTPALATHISEAAQKADIPITMATQEHLDYSTSVVLHYLIENLPNIAILPIGYSSVPTKQHLAFGSVLKDIFLSVPKRIAVIASGNLSHALSADSPAPYSKFGQQFDDNLIELLETRNTVGIANMPKNMVEESQECAYRSIIILLGILQKMDYSFERYSYEAPFGVGYLVGNFIF